MEWVHGAKRARKLAHSPVNGILCFDRLDCPRVKTLFWGPKIWSEKRSGLVWNPALVLALTTSVFKSRSPIDESLPATAGYSVSRHGCKLGPGFKNRGRPVRVEQPGDQTGARCPGLGPKKSPGPSRGPKPAYWLGHAWRSTIATDPNPELQVAGTVPARDPGPQVAFRPAFSTMVIQSLQAPSGKDQEPVRHVMVDHTAAPTPSPWPRRFDPRGPAGGRHAGVPRPPPSRRVG
jgi:hypothetical protein